MKEARKYHVAYRLPNTKGQPENFSRDVFHSTIHYWVSEWARNGENHLFEWLTVEGVNITPKEHNAVFLVLGIPQLEINYHVKVAKSPAS